MTNNDILNKIKAEIKQDYYIQHFSNDGQRFVAWYLRNVHLLDSMQTKSAMTDGANDKQIDAVYIDDDDNKIYIIQGKFYTGPSIDATPVKEVISVHSLLTSDLAALQAHSNYKLKIKLGEISNALENDGYSIVYELITTSFFTKEARKDIESFQNKLANDENAKFETEFVVVELNDIYDNYYRAMEQDNPSINHSIILEKGKYLFTTLSGTKVLIAAMSLKECTKFPGIKNGTLFQKNVRQSLGHNNSVNKKIKKTIMSERCSDFFFYHNGITAICNKMEETGEGSIKLHGLSVVNGCQSLNTILDCSETVKQKDEAYVLVRFYEIPQRDRADSISTNTNTQSAVKARDLRSNDKRVLRLKKAYEQKYPQGYFATKRGDITPADKNKIFTIELSELGKNLIAWYSQRPNLSYGETKIFDKYFDTLFRNEYSAEDMFALKFWMSKIMEIWTEANPLMLNETILTMKAYAPYHFLFAISAIFAKLNGNNNVPSPKACYDTATNNNLVEQIIGVAAACFNSAFEAEINNAQIQERTFIPQNWIKSKASISKIQVAVTNYISFLPSMNPSQHKLFKEKLKIDSKEFSYRLTAD